jgi:crotonobetainyl-CoA:carnitine CoA-transferase CaiB-like acyl-CoA transferase
MSGGPLSGVRVLDMTHVLNGPFCTLLLAHLGAEVIKVETGKGDRFRHAWAPPGVTRDAYDFIAVNNNKKAVTLNLKTIKGKDLFREFTKRCDVVVENFTVGVMDRLGLGYADLKEINPRIIYACSRGYGETGPYSHVRANASTITAVTGWLDEASRMADSPGAKLPVELGDEAAGVSMCMAILAALYNREHSGHGQKIEVSMQEAFMGFMVSMFHRHFEGVTIGADPKPCVDGFYSFHLPDITDKLWGQLTQALGRGELREDPRFRTVMDRRKNHREVEQEVSQMVGSKTRQQLWDALRPLGISSGPLLTVAEALEDPHLKERAAFVEFDIPQGGKMKFSAPWMRFSDTPTSLHSIAPGVGQHNKEVYGQVLGLSDDEIAELQKEGVIA